MIGHDRRIYLTSCGYTIVALSGIKFGCSQNEKTFWAELAHFSFPLSLSLYLWAALLGHFVFYRWEDNKKQSKLYIPVSLVGNLTAQIILRTELSSCSPRLVRIVIYLVQEGFRNRIGAASERKVKYNRFKLPLVPLPAQFWRYMIYVFREY